MGWGGPWGGRSLGVRYLFAEGGLRHTPECPTYTTVFRCVPSVGSAAVVTGRTCAGVGRFRGGRPAVVHASGV